MPKASTKRTKRTTPGRRKETAITTAPLLPAATATTTTTAPPPPPDTAPLIHALRNLYKLLDDDLFESEYLRERQRRDSFKNNSNNSNNNNNEETTVAAEDDTTVTMNNDTAATGDARKKGNSSSKKRKAAPSSRLSTSKDSARRKRKRKEKTTNACSTSVAAAPAPTAATPTAAIAVATVGRKKAAPTNNTTATATTAATEEEQQQPVTTTTVAALSVKRFERHQEQWDMMYSQLLDFQLVHGHLNVPTKNKALWMWVKNQKYYWRKACKGQVTQLSRENMARLVYIGMGKSIESGPTPCREMEITTAGWQERFVQLSAFQREFHHCDLSSSHRYKGTKYASLANWADWQRNCHHNKVEMAATGQLRHKNTPVMTDKQEALLQSIGFRFHKKIPKPTTAEAAVAAAAAATTEPTLVDPVTLLPVTRRGIRTTLLPESFMTSPFYHQQYAQFHQQLQQQQQQPRQHSTTTTTTTTHGNTTSNVNNNNNNNYQFWPPCAI